MTDNEPIAPKPEPKLYYTVAKTDGWLVDDQGRYLRDAIAYDCGHKHRTEAGADKCHTKLLNWSKDGKKCSAKWYNAKVLCVDKDGRHVPEVVVD